MLAICAPLIAALSARADDAAVVFENDILPILTAHCFKCHGLEARKAGLDLRTVGMMKRGGDNGPVITAGSADKSMLYERIADRSMPPENELPLSDAKIELLRRWLDAGAPALQADEPPPDAAAPPAVTDEDRQFWSFQKPRRAAVPDVGDISRVRTPIDAFVLARLEEKSLSLSPEADRATLIRRASYDLVGLPPSPDEVETYVHDAAAGAYERMVDRLLASPHFGERWGRHWLDAAGYVDTIGDDTDAAITKVSTGKWLYRDYVVRAFNEDKPFDRFLVEQLAGDELIDWQSAEVLTEQMQQLLIATGMLRTAADETLQNELNTADIREAVLEHTMEVVASNLLGLTVNCARCHSHKFDPIPQEDYYRLLAIFSPAFNPQTWLQPAQRELPDISQAEKTKAEAHNAELDKQVAERNARLAALRKPYEDRLFDEKLATLPEAIRADTKAAIQTPADKRNEVQKYLAGKFAETLKVSPQETAAALSPEDKSGVDALDAEIAGAQRPAAQLGHDSSGVRRRTAAGHVPVAAGKSRPAGGRSAGRLFARAVRVPRPSLRRRRTAQFAHQRPPPGVCPLADPARRCGRRTRVPGLRESRLAVPVWPGHRRHQRKPGPFRRPAHASRAARLAGRRVSIRRLAGQAAGQVDHDLERLSPGFAPRSPSGRERFGRGLAGPCRAGRSGQRAAVADAAAAARIRGPARRDPLGQRQAGGHRRRTAHAARGEARRHGRRGNEIESAAIRESPQPVPVGAAAATTFRCWKPSISPS